MSSSNATASASTSQPTPTINLPLFARGTIALLTLWPALRLAVSEQWGGPDSGEKRTWMISEVVDYFEGALPNKGKEREALSVEELGDIIDRDDLAEMLDGMISDEFDADLDDNSPDQVAGDIVRLWKSIVKGEDGMVLELEGLVAASAGRKVQAQRSGDGEVEVDQYGNPVEEGSDDEESGDEDEDEDMEGGGAAGGSGSAAPKEKEKQEPVVDDDGFTLVQKKGKK